MPGLDYRKNVRVLGAYRKRKADHRFYDGTPGRELTTCPDCKRPADAMFGDHGGSCANGRGAVPPNSAAGIIRRHAVTHSRFSANDVREALDQADIPGNARGPAFGYCKRRGWIEEDGRVRSLDGPTKGHPVNTYTSLIYQGI